MSTPTWWVAIHDPIRLHIDDFDLGDCPTCDGEGGRRRGGIGVGAVLIHDDCPDCEGMGTWAYNYEDSEPFPVEPARCSVCSGPIEPDAKYPLCPLHEASSREGGRALAEAQRQEEVA